PTTSRTRQKMPCLSARAGGKTRHLFLSMSGSASRLVHPRSITMKSFACGLLTIALVVLSPMLANAALSLSFDQATYSISAPGQTSLVSVYLTQSAGGAQVGPGNTLISAALNLVFNSPGGIAAVSAVTDITPSALFDSSSRGVSATNATLGET